jgi:hypothetical protein
MRYATVSVEFPGSILEVAGEYIKHDDHIEFQVILIYEGNSVLYKTWQRALWHRHPDLDSMLQVPTDPKIVKIADTFEKMGEATFKIRFQTLLFEASGTK